MKNYLLVGELTSKSFIILLFAQLVLKGLITLRYQGLNLTPLGFDILKRTKKPDDTSIYTQSIFCSAVHVKFIYSEKATKFCEFSTVDLSYVVPVKSTVEISQNFVAFSEYVNFISPFGFQIPTRPLNYAGRLLA